MTVASQETVPASLPRPRLSVLQESDLSAELLVPEGIGPKPVQEAAARARKAFGAYQEERLAFQEAEEDAKEAPALDERADARALEQGEDLPEPTAPAARKALADANRRRLAAAENLRAAIYAQAEAMREHYGEWVTAVERRLEKRTAAIRKLVDELGEEFTELGTLQELQRALESFNGNPVNWLYQPPRRDRDQRRREQFEKDLALRRRGSGGPSVEREPAALLAALKLEVDPQ